MLEKFSLITGKDIQRYFAIIPVVNAIDNIIDRFSPDQWPDGEAHLGGKPCIFLQKLLALAEGSQQHIEKLADTHGVRHHDMWQCCNLLAMQVARIRDIAKDVRAHPGDLTLRRALVEEQEQLSILSINFCVADFKRAGGTLDAMLDPANLQVARKAALIKRNIVVNNIPRQESDISAYGAMQQAVDDATDLIVDLRAEIEQDRISPNRYILMLREQGIDPAHWLQKLKTDYPNIFRHGDMLDISLLGKVGQMIREDLNRHRTEIGKSAYHFALCGKSFRAEHFPTTGADLDSAAAQDNRTGKLSWGQRLQEARVAFEQPYTLGLQ